MCLSADRRLAGGTAAGAIFGNLKYALRKAFDVLQVKVLPGKGRSSR